MSQTFDLYLQDETGRRIALGQETAKFFDEAAKKAKSRHSKTLSRLSTKWQWKIVDKNNLNEVRL